jgi:polysaccharide transporter, PST family
MRQDWMKYIPTVIRLRLKGGHSIVRVISNISWLFADKIIRLGVGLLIGIRVARYLGPVQFGVFNYSVAFAGLFSVLANLGLDSIVVKKLIHDSEHRDEILGTTFWLKFIAGVVTFLITLCAIMQVRTNDSVTLWLVGIIAAGTIFQAFDTVDLFFQAQVNSKFTVYAKNGTFLFANFLKIVLVLLKSPLVYFAWLGLFEIVCGALGLIIVYRVNGYIIRSWRLSKALAFGLLKDSWPLMLSGFFVIILLKTDQVMLGNIRGNKEVGIFSAALRLSELWYFIPISITMSIFPALANCRKTNHALYIERINQLYLLMLLLSLFIAIPISFLSDKIIMRIYGIEYLNAAMVLSIHCWTGVFIFGGTISNLWYLLEGINQYAMYRSIVGASLNVCLNLILIPKYGATGAAVSTLVTQFVASYLFELINKKTRIIFYIKTKCFVYFVPLTLKIIKTKVLSSSN